MRAIIEAINVRPMGGEMFLKPGVKPVDIFLCVLAQRHAALIADYDNLSTGAVQRGNSGLSAGQEVKVARAADVSPFRWLAIDDSIAIEKDIANVREYGFHLAVRINGESEMDGLG